jgi:hypothetical protein
MNKLLALLLASAASLTLAGCLDDGEFIVWSHDGSRAAVIAHGDLYLCDGYGKFSQVMTGDPPHAVKAQALEGLTVSWMPDSKRLVLVTQRQVGTWAAGAPLLPPARQKWIIANAPKVREELLAYEGKLDQFAPKSIPDWGRWGNGDLEPTLMYLRDQGDKALDAKLGGNVLRDMKANVYVLAICDPLVSPARIETITESLVAIMGSRVAPSGNTVAFVSGDPNGEQAGRFLMIVPAKPGSKPQLVAHDVSYYFDWTPDSKALVFGRASLPPPNMPTGESAPLRLGALTRREVCDATGAILPKFLDPQDLAGVVFDELSRVCCLKDGRILFTAGDVHFPCTASDMPAKATLFAVDPARQAMVTRVWGQSTDIAIPDRVDFFQVSPDQNRVAIRGRNGDVAVVTLADGKVDHPQSAEPNVDFYLIPAWRSDDELCFLSPANDPGAPRKHEVVLWSLSRQTARTISSTWPAEVVNAFLETQTPATQPTTPSVQWTTTDPPAAPQPLEPDTQPAQKATTQPQPK